jgi:hypothetical protein
MMKANSFLAKGARVLVAATVVVLGMAVKSEAAFIAYICDDPACVGGGDFTAVDGGAGDALPGVPGFISLTAGAPVNGYEIVINLSQSKPVLSTGMDLNYTVTNVAGTNAGGTVWLYAVDTDFAGPTGLSGHLDGNQLNGSATAFICGGNNNDPRLPPVNTGPCSSASDNTTPDIDIDLAHIATANPYSLTIGVAITGVNPGDTATGDFRVVPEPATLALFGMGLLGAGAAIRRRRPNAA